MSDQMLQKLDSIIENTRPKNFGFDITIVQKGIRYRINYTPSIQLEGRWGIAFQKLATYNSIANIDKTNNKFKYFNGTTWKSITIGEGSYEISQLNDEVIRLMKLNNDYDTANDKPYLWFEPNLSRLTTILYLENGYKADFTVVDSIASILGFGKTVVDKAYNESMNTINIIDVNSILVHCNLVKSSYYNGSQGNIIHVIPVNTSPGFRMISEPFQQRFHEVQHSTISYMEVWLTDDNNKPLNNRNELVTISLRLEQL